LGFFQTAVEMLVGFLGLLFIMKFLGKISLKQITPFDFISALILGETVGNAIYDGSVGAMKILFTIFFWGMLMYVVQILTQKSITLRGLLEGTPAILIKHGEIQFQTLKKNRMDLDQLRFMLRSAGAYTFEEVDYAILETDGSVNIVKNHQYQTVTKGDCKIPRKRFVLPIVLISDGKLLKRNLLSSGVSQSWLDEQLNQKGIQRYKDVMIAEWNQEDESLTIKKY
jgi:uncharacterized membrane protein YcaP (DUF421 family)